jgi:hypothetical protein
VPIALMTSSRVMRRDPDRLAMTFLRRGFADPHQITAHHSGSAAANEN